MFNKMSKVKYFCGLDLGSHTLKASIIRVQDEQNLELLGVYESRTTGMKEASISDINELSECIGRVVNGVCQKANLKIQAVELGLSGDLLTTRRSSAVVPLIESGTKVIAKSDVKKVDHQAKLLGAGLEEEVIHYFPQQYKVDDVNVSLNPLGLYGRKLEANLLLLVANSIRVRNFIKAVHQAGFEVSGLAFSAYASSEVAMEKGIKDQGCVLVDIGANITTLLFFKNGTVGDVQFIPWGGNYVTQSIAERLNLTTDLAEDIKKTHAVASTKNPQESSGEILVKREKGYMPISRVAVCEAVNWEIENLLTHVETLVKGSALYHQMNKGIVMVGGGALLPGLMERIEERTNLPVSIGAATNGLNNASLYAASIGLAHVRFLTQKDAGINFRNAKNLKEKIVNTVKEVCQEYF